MNTTRETIIQAGQNTGHNYTEKQVNQILRRREVLLRESRNIQRDKKREIDLCWNWWRNES
jgi:hypothetical protein